jgi:hypothetical protein
MVAATSGRSCVVARVKQADGGGSVSNQGGIVPQQPGSDRSAQGQLGVHGPNTVIRGPVAELTSIVRAPAPNVREV